MPPPPRVLSLAPVSKLSRLFLSCPRSVAVRIPILHCLRLLCPLCPPAVPPRECPPSPSMDEPSKKRLRTSHAVSAYPPHWPARCWRCASGLHTVCSASAIYAGRERSGGSHFVDGVPCRSLAPPSISPLPLASLPVPIIRTRRPVYATDSWLFLLPQMRRQSALPCMHDG